MLYITGLHALNIPCSLPTTGDWHASTLDWSAMPLSESTNSIFLDYGIERDKKVSYLSHINAHDPNNLYNVANHIRAVLDILELGNISLIQGFRENFFCVDIDIDDFFHKVSLLDKLNHWGKINLCMEHEYYMKWVNFRKTREDLDVKNECHDECNNECNDEWRKKHTKNIEMMDVKRDNKILEYDENTLFLKKLLAYSGTSAIQDLYDIAFLYKNYKNCISEDNLKTAQTILSYKGWEHFDYILNKQKNSLEEHLIDRKNLVENFLYMWEDLDLRCDAEDIEIIKKLRS